jgi:hypothetical protein
MQIHGAILALISAGTLAAGTITTYTDRASFLAAINAIPQPHTTTEFEAFDGPDNFVSPHGPDTSIPGVTIQDWSDWDGHWPEHSTNVSNGVLNGCDGHFCGPLGLLYVTTTWTFAAPIYAFGADFTYPGGDTSNGLVLCLGPTPCYATSPSIPYQNGFAGFISDQRFSQITFTAADRLTPPPDCPFCRYITQSFTMDNLVYESSAPEPGTSALMLLGVVGIATAFRPRRHVKEEQDAGRL